MSDPIKVWRIALPSVKGEGWGIFLIDSSGMFTCVTDFGNYAYKWTHHGMPDFREFIITLSRDYTIGKLSPDEEYDGDKTLKHVKTAILEYRRESPKRYSKEWSRNEWDLLEQYSELAHEGDFNEWSNETELGDAWEMRCQRPPYMIQGFMDRLLPRLKEHLKEMLRVERAQPLSSIAEG